MGNTVGGPVQRVVYDFVGPFLGGVTMIQTIADNVTGVEDGTIIHMGCAGHTFLALPHASGLYYTDTVITVARGVGVAANSATYPK